MARDHQTRRALIRLAVIAAAFLALSAGAPRAFAGTQSQTWYAPGSGLQTCWQTGVPGASAQACGTVGAGYLPTPGSNAGGLQYMLGGAGGEGIGTDLNIQPDLVLGAPLPSGDYCNTYRLGDNLIYQDANNESAYTGWAPYPGVDYQEGDAHEDVCQAAGDTWGQEIRDWAGLCPSVCGMHHWVSLGDQEAADRPWSSWFANPEMILDVSAGFASLATAGTTGAWGYVCPELVDTASGPATVPLTIEFCMEEGVYDYSEGGACGTGYGNNAQIISQIASGAARTPFVTPLSGSAQTFSLRSSNGAFAPGSGHFVVAITEANLRAAISAIQTMCPGEPFVNLSTNLSDYSLIGVEQGIEGFGPGFREMGANEEHLTVSTSYDLGDPQASTGPPSMTGQDAETLTGTVVQGGADTTYAFQWGDSATYGQQTAVADAGAGAGRLDVTATLSALAPGATYHYRLMASSSGATVYGGDQTFTTPAPVTTSSSTSSTTTSSSTVTSSTTSSTTPVISTVTKTSPSSGSTVTMTTTSSAAASSTTTTSTTSSGALSTSTTTAPTSTTSSAMTTSHTQSQDSSEQSSGPAPNLSIAVPASTSSAPAASTSNGALTAAAICALVHQDAPGFQCFIPGPTTTTPVTPVHLSNPETPANRPLTRAQKLARELKACLRLKRPARARCVTVAHRRYDLPTPKKPAHR